MGRAGRALIALVIAGMLVLSGCSGQNPNYAATVDGAVIPVSEADALFTVLEPYLQNPSPASAVSVLVTSRVGAQIAVRQGLEFTSDEREMAAASVLPPDLAADPNAAGFATDYVTTALVSQQLGQEGFIQAAAEVDVVVNPRFGSWDPSQVAVVPGTGSLSSPAPVS